MTVVELFLVLGLCMFVFAIVCGRGCFDVSFSSSLLVSLRLIGEVLLEGSDIFIPLVILLGLAFGFQGMVFASFVLLVAFLFLRDRSNTLIVLKEFPFFSRSHIFEFCVSSLVIGVLDRLLIFIDFAPYQTTRVRGCDFPAGLQAETGKSGWLRRMCCI